MSRFQALVLLVVVSLVMLDCTTTTWAFAPRPTLQKFVSRTRIRERHSRQPQPPTDKNCFVVAAAKAKKNSEDDDDEKFPTGMDAAFRQLGALDSLGDPQEGSKQKSTVQLDEQSKAELLLRGEEAPSLEQEVKLFKELLEDAEQDQGTLYSDVIKEMGGTPQPQQQQEQPPRQIIVEETFLLETPSSLSTSSSSSFKPPTEQDTQKFMDLAIQEALEEARRMAPAADASKMSDSILDDEEIMKEIEEIFEKGNEKLMASLEEIRQEQVSAQRNVDN
jgi:hypothetical protein